MRLVAAIKTGVATLCANMNEAGRRGIRVDFNIRCNELGEFVVHNLDVLKKL